MKEEEDFLCPRPLTHHRLFWLSHPFIHIHRSSSCLIWSSAPSAGHDRNKKNLKPTPSASYFLHFPIQRQQRLALDDWNFLFLLVRQNWIEKGKKKRHTHTQVCKFVFNCVCWADGGGVEGPETGGSVCPHHDHDEWHLYKRRRKKEPRLLSSHVRSFFLSSSFPMKCAYLCDDDDDDDGSHLIKPNLKSVERKRPMRQKERKN